MQFLTQSMINKIKHMTFIPIRYMYGPGDKCGLLKIKPHDAPLYKPHHEGYYDTDDVSISQVLHTHKYDYSFNEIKKMYEKSFSLNSNTALGYDAVYIRKQSLRGMQMKTFNQCIFPCVKVPHADFHNECILAQFSGNKKKHDDLIKYHKLIIQTADQYLIPNLYRTMKFIKAARWYYGEDEDLMYALTYNSKMKQIEPMMDFHREMGIDYHDFDLIDTQKKLFYNHNLTAFITIPVAALEYITKDQAKWIFDKEQQELNDLANTEELDSQFPMWEALQRDTKALIKARMFRDTMMACMFTKDNRKNRFDF